jgi:hypothetical protein
MVTDAIKENPTHTAEFDVSRSRTHFRMRGDHLQGLLELLT